MSQGPKPRSSASKTPADSYVSGLCERFEREWRAGNTTRVEDLLESVPAEHYDSAMRKLLLLEWDLKVAAGQTPQLDQWLQRFPNKETLIRSIWDSAFETREFRAGETEVHSVCTATHYSDLRHFRTGGMADLFLAYDKELGRETVVKRLRTQFRDDSACAAQLGVEAEITGRLDHPGIVPVYGVGQDWDGQPFYVMRRIRGRDLQSAITDYHQAGGPANDSRDNRRRLFDLLEHLISACNTIAFAHDAGIVHCDIKPMNIMIGKYGETFVVDWGLCRPFDRSTEFRKANEPTIAPRNPSQSDLRGFTPGYVSPEQFAGAGDLGPASDIYSLGATLYQILTNQKPLVGSEPDYLERLSLGQFPRPRSVQPRIPRALEAICLKALHTSSTSRHSTAKQLAADLQNWMHDEEIDSFPDGMLARLSRWARHHRNTAMATMLTTVTLVVAAILTGTSVRHARLADTLRGQAEERFDTALSTFEQLSTPLANEERNLLGVFNPLAQNIVRFTEDFLSDRKVMKSRTARLARIRELRASANFALEANRAAFLDDLRQAEAIYREQLDQAPDDTAIAWRLACNRLTQGRAFVRFGEDDKAGDPLNAALHDLEQLQKASALPVNASVITRREAEVHHALGEYHLNLANRRGEGDNYQQSKLHFQRSRALREKLVEEAASGDHYEQATLQRDLARSHGYLGDLFLRLGDVSQAEREYEDSLRLRMSLYRNNPADPEHRFQYARGLANFGAVELVQRRNLEKAIERLGEARTIQEGLNRDFPRDFEFGIDLGWTLQSMAELHLLAAASVTEAHSREQHLKSMGEVAREARIVYRGLPADDPQVARGLAFSSVLLAEAWQDAKPAEAANFARQAEKILTDLHDKTSPEQNDYFLMALIAGILDRKDDAVESLASAVQNGSNTLERFGAHRQFGLRSVAGDTSYGAELDKWLQKARERVAGP